MKGSNRSKYRKDNLPPGSGMLSIRQQEDSIKTAGKNDKSRSGGLLVRLFHWCRTRSLYIFISSVIVAFLLLISTNEVAQLRVSSAKQAIQLGISKINLDDDGNWFTDTRDENGEFAETVNTDKGVDPKYLTKNITLAERFGTGDGEHFHGDVGTRSDGTPSWFPEPLDHKMTQEELETAWEGYSFNTRLSKSLPLDRPVPEFNHPKCLKKAYELEDMPSATVVFVFHNEDLSVLLRSIHSVLDRTPPQILREIVLVDDDSNGETHPWLKDELDDILENYPKVRIRRLFERHGLMMARVRGGEWARGDVVVFLDSHIEATKRWLEPMLEVIQQNPRIITVPKIPGIHHETFDLSSGGVGAITFSWTLGQVHLPDVSSYENFDSPCMAGGLLAANRHYFMEVIGGYDPEMRLYGGEEFEIGFKAWMCGGGIQVVPCSRVGHIFRSNQYWKGQVYKVPGHEIARNKRRVAHVWMDEYKEIALASISSLPDDNPIGDLSYVSNIRNTCLNGGPSHSFQWFMDNVAKTVWHPELYDAQTQERTGYLGAVRLASDTRQCLDTMGSDGNGPYGIYSCHYGGGSQAFLVDELAGLVRAAYSKFERCLMDSVSNNKVNAAMCPKSNSGSGVWDFQWVYESDDMEIPSIKKEGFYSDNKMFHLKSKATGKCLSYPSLTTASLVECDSKDKTQLYQLVYQDFEAEVIDSYGGTTR